MHRPLVRPKYWGRIRAGRAGPFARFFRGRGPEPGPVTLDRSRVFVLPTRHGVTLALGLVAMFVGAVNYESSLGLLLTFWLASTAFVSLLHTYHNLAHLRLGAGRPEAVFAGAEARFPVWMENPSGRPRRSLRVRADEGEGPEARAAVESESAVVWLTRTASQRGRLRLGRFTTHTRYPLGLFRAWAPLELETACLVYPAPGPHRPLPTDGAPSTGDADAGSRGTDDFEGLRGYLPGDSPRSIHWRASARSGALLTKLWSGGAPAVVWLAWENLDDPDPEIRLSALCRWVLDAHAAGLSWGLRLPGTEVAAAGGDAHLRRCLEALALWQP
ncbi:MAG: DUF58 domain-containing protein [Deltaproteobacteria bacterium]|nr:DUF58 domain-containing protein [Deltaproteobacteria bacterium]